MVAPGITSPGLTERLAMGLDVSIRRDAPHAKGWNLWQRGYYVLDLTPARAQGAWYLVPDVVTPVGDESFAFAVSTAAGANHLVTDATPAEGRAGPPAAP